MKEYSTYLFDLDGTITDTMAVWFGILRDALLAFEITPPDDKTLSQYTHDWKEIVKLGLKEEKIDSFTKFCHQLANGRLADAPFHNGAVEMLTLLKQKGKRLGIFSTMDRSMFDPTMRHRNLYTFVEVAVAGTDVPYRKPHPAGILKALQDLKIPEKEYSSAVYIGDKDTDIQAAINAGIDGILYYPVSHQQVYDLAELKKCRPIRVISDWHDLLL
jgi:HAD superfamily hydrolase (TIGR01549 family)